MTVEINKPAAWEDRPLDELMACNAGQAYVLEQICDRGANPIKPEHCFSSDRESGDAASYEVYEDDSLWFVNNAEDEVWEDFRDFVQRDLISGLEAQNACGRMRWSADDCEDADGFRAFPMDEMDRQLLILYCEGDEDAARELAGCSAAK